MKRTYIIFILLLVLAILAYYNTTGAASNEMNRMRQKRNIKGMSLMADDF